MQTLMPLRVRLAAPMLVTTGLLVIWLLPPLSNWFRSLVKLEPMRMPYTMGFFVLLFCMLTLLVQWVGRHRFIFVITAGAGIGQIIAFVSIFIANFFIPDGVARTASTLQRDGALGILLTDFTVAAILGGWFLGAVAFAVLRWITSRSSSPARGL
jgi:hypothetical protein